ncbi:chromosomal replication initiation protein DnaA, partial [Amycolatopsis sp. 3B14]
MSEHQLNLGVVWDQVVRELSDGTLSPQQRAWMRVTRPIGLLDGTALLAAPSDFAKEAIERALRDPITHALSRRLGRPVSLAVKVDTAEVTPPPPPPPAPYPSPTRVETAPVAAAEAPVMPPKMPPLDDGMLPPLRRGRAHPPEPVKAVLPEDDGDEEVDEEGEALAAAHEIWPMFSRQPSAGQP